MTRCPTLQFEGTTLAWVVTSPCNRFRLLWKLGPVARQPSASVVRDPKELGLGGPTVEKNRLRNFSKRERVTEKKNQRPVDSLIHARFRISLRLTGFG